MGKRLSFVVWDYVQRSQINVPLRVEYKMARKFHGVLNHDASNRHNDKVNSRSQPRSKLPKNIAIQSRDYFVCFLRLRPNAQPASQAISRAAVRISIRSSKMAGRVREIVCDGIGGTTIDTFSTTLDVSFFETRVFYRPRLATFIVRHCSLPENS